MAGALTSRPCSVALASAKERLLGQGTLWVSRAAAPDEAYQLVWVADGLDRGSWRMLRSPPTSGRLRPSVTDELPHPQGSQGQRGHFSVEAECRVGGEGLSRLTWSGSWNSTRRGGGRLASRAGVPCTPDGAPQAQGCLPVAVMPAQWLPAAAGHMQQNAQRAVPQPPRPGPPRPPHARRTRRAAASHDLQLGRCADSVFGRRCL